MESCDICFNTFSEIKYIPKVLDCGHTVCSICLNGLFKSQRLCPKCKKPVTKASIENYPTNYILLTLTQSKGSHYCFDSHVFCSLETLKNQFIQRKESMVKSIGERTSLKNLILNDLAKIHQTLDMDRDILQVSGANNLMTELENDLYEVDKVLYCCKPNFRTTFSLIDFKLPRLFLYQIANRLYKGETIYSCETVEGQIKYGKLSIDDSKISIHVLSSSTVDQKSSVVWFRDLKKCMTSENLLTFIDIGTQKWHFTIVDSSFLVAQFIKLCTGETGSMLQGAGAKLISVGTLHYQNIKHSYLGIEKYMLNGSEAEGFIDYDLSECISGNERTFNVGDTFVQHYPKGISKICQCSTQGTKYENVVAKLHKESKFEMRTVQSAIIKDCGISIPL